MNRAEEILLTSLAAYGLLKILEGILCPAPRPVVVVVDAEMAAELRELLDDEDEE